MRIAAHTQRSSNRLGAETAPEIRSPKVAHAAFCLLCASSLGCDAAVGYRFDQGGRSVVISGDTDVSRGLQSNNRGVDLLVREALLKDLAGQRSEGFGRAGKDRLQRKTADIIDDHTSPAEALAAAREAEVDTSVMTHLVPPLPGRLRISFFTRSLETGDVDVVLGEDGMHLRWPADSEAIEQETLGL